MVLDRTRALIVQPDVIFVDTKKLRWYERYGVRECWFVDPVGRSVKVVECQTKPT